MSDEAIETSRWLELSPDPDSDKGECSLNTFKSRWRSKYQSRPAEISADVCSSASSLSQYSLNQTNPSYNKDLLKSSINNSANAVSVLSEYELSGKLSFSGVNLSEYDCRYSQAPEFCNSINDYKTKLCETFLNQSEDCCCSKSSNCNISNSCICKYPKGLVKASSFLLDCQTSSVGNTSEQNLETDQSVHDYSTKFKVPERRRNQKKQSRDETLSSKTVHSNYKKNRKSLSSSLENQTKLLQVRDSKVSDFQNKLISEQRQFENKCKVENERLINISANHSCDQPNISNKRKTKLKSNSSIKRNSSLQEATSHLCKNSVDSDVVISSNSEYYPLGILSDTQGSWISSLSEASLQLNQTSNNSSDIDELFYSIKQKSKHQEAESSKEKSKLLLKNTKSNNLDKFAVTNQRNIKSKSRVSSVDFLTKLLQEQAEHTKEVETKRNSTTHKVPPSALEPKKSKFSLSDFNISKVKSVSSTGCRLSSFSSSSRSNCVTFPDSLCLGKHQNLSDISTSTRISVSSQIDVQHNNGTIANLESVNSKTSLYKGENKNLIEFDQNSKLNSKKYNNGPSLGSISSQVSNDSRFNDKEVLENPKLHCNLKQSPNICNGTLTDVNHDSINSVPKNKKSHCNLKRSPNVGNGSLTNVNQIHDSVPQNKKSHCINLKQSPNIGNGLLTDEKQIHSVAENPKLHYNLKQNNPTVFDTTTKSSNVLNDVKKIHLVSENQKLRCTNLKQSPNIGNGLLTDEKQIHSVAENPKLHYNLKQNNPTVFDNTTNSSNFGNGPLTDVTQTHSNKNLIQDRANTDTENQAIFCTKIPKILKIKTNDNFTQKEKYMIKMEKSNAETQFEAEEEVNDMECTLVSSSSGNYDDTNTRKDGEEDEIQKKEDNEEKEVEQAIMEISSDVIFGNLLTLDTTSEDSDGGSSHLSSDIEAKRVKSGQAKYPETASGLSDNDWNPYTTESDSNMTPRINPVNICNERAIQNGSPKENPEMAEKFSELKLHNSKVVSVDAEANKPKAEFDNVEMGENCKSTISSFSPPFTSSDIRKQEQTSTTFPYSSRYSSLIKSDSANSTPNNLSNKSSSVLEFSPLLSSTGLNETQMMQEVNRFNITLSDVSEVTEPSLGNIKLNTKTSHNPVTQASSRENLSDPGTDKEACLRKEHVNSDYSGQDLVKLTYNEPDFIRKTSKNSSAGSHMMNTDDYEQSGHKGTEYEITHKTSNSATKAFLQKDQLFCDESNNLTNTKSMSTDVPSVLSTKTPVGFRRMNELQEETDKYGFKDSRLRNAAIIEQKTHLKSTLNTSLSKSLDDLSTDNISTMLNDDKKKNISTESLDQIKPRQNRNILKEVGNYLTTFPSQVPLDISHFSSSRYSQDWSRKGISSDFKYEPRISRHGESFSQIPVRDNNRASINGNNTHSIVPSSNRSSRSAADQDHKVVKELSRDETGDQHELHNGINYNSNAGHQLSSLVYMEKMKKANPLDVSSVLTDKKARENTSTLDISNYSISSSDSPRNQKVKQIHQDLKEIQNTLNYSEDQEFVGLMQHEASNVLSSDSNYHSYNTVSPGQSNNENKSHTELSTVSSQLTSPPEPSPQEPPSHGNVTSSDESSDIVPSTTSSTPEKTKILVHNLRQVFNDQNSITTGQRNGRESHSSGSVYHQGSLAEIRPSNRQIPGSRCVDSISKLNTSIKLSYGSEGEETGASTSSGQMDGNLSDKAESEVTLTEQDIDGEPSVSFGNDNLLQTLNQKHNVIHMIESLRLQRQALEESFRNPGSSVPRYQPIINQGERLQEPIDLVGGLANQMEHVIRQGNPPSQIESNLSQIFNQDHELREDIYRRICSDSSFSDTSIGHDETGTSLNLAINEVRRRLDLCNIPSESPQKMIESVKKPYIPPLDLNAKSPIKNIYHDRSIFNSGDFTTPKKHVVQCYPLYGFQRDENKAQPDNKYEAGPIEQHPGPSSDTSTWPEAGRVSYVKRDFEGSEEVSDIQHTSVGEYHMSRKNESSLTTVSAERSNSEISDSSPDTLNSPSRTDRRAASSPHGEQSMEVSQDWEFRHPEIPDLVQPVSFKSNLSGTAGQPEEESSPSSPTYSSPRDSDYSAAGSKVLTRFRPFRLSGQQPLESDTGSLLDTCSITTMESTHTGSDDAIGPELPNSALGSRPDINQHGGIYSKDSKETIITESALSTIEETSVVDDRLSESGKAGNRGYNSHQSTNKMPSAVETDSGVYTLTSSLPSTIRNESTQQVKHTTYVNIQPQIYDNSSRNTIHQLQTGSDQRNVNPERQGNGRHSPLGNGRHSPLDEKYRVKQPVQRSLSPYFNDDLTEAAAHQLQSKKSKSETNMFDASGRISPLEFQKPVRVMSLDRGQELDYAYQTKGDESREQIVSRQSHTPVVIDMTQDKRRERTAPIMSPVVIDSQSVHGPNRTTKSKDAQYSRYHGEGRIMETQVNTGENSQTNPYMVPTNRDANMDDRLWRNQRSVSPVTMDTRHHPVTMDTRNHPATMDTRQQSVTMDTRQHSVTMDTRQHPFTMDTRQLPVAMDTRQHPVTMDTRQHPVTMDTRQQPISPLFDQQKYIEDRYNMPIDESTQKQTSKTERRKQSEKNRPQYGQDSTSEEEYLHLEKSPLSTRTLQLQQSLVQEIEQSNSQDLKSIWPKYSEIYPSEAESQVNPEQTEVFADLVNHPTRELIFKYFAERARSRRLIEKRLAKEREARHQQSINKSEKFSSSEDPLPSASFEQMNASYGEILEALAAERAKRLRRETKAKSLSKSSQKQAKLDKHKSHKHSSVPVNDSQDALYVIPEDQSYDTLAATSNSHSYESRELNSSVEDPMMVLKHRIIRQRDKIEKERRRDIKRLEKLWKLEQLLKAKSSGAIGNFVLENNLNEISSTSTAASITDSHDGLSYNESSLTLSSQTELSDELSTTIKDSSYEAQQIKLHRSRQQAADHYQATLNLLLTSGSSDTLTEGEDMPSWVKKQKSQKKRPEAPETKLTPRSRKHEKPVKLNEKDKSVKEKGRKIMETRSKTQSSPYKVQDRKHKSPKKPESFEISPVKWNHESTRVTSPSKSSKSARLLKNLAKHISPVKNSKPSQMSKDSSYDYSYRARSVSPPRYCRSRGVQTSPADIRSRSCSPSFSKNYVLPVPVVVKKKSKHRGKTLYISGGYGPDVRENHPPKRLKRKRIPQPVSWYIPLADKQKPKPLQERVPEQQTVPQPPVKQRAVWTISNDYTHLPENDQSTADTTPQLDQSSKMTIDGEIFQKPYAVSLQEALLKHKKDFISKSRERQKRIALAAEHRQMQDYLQLERDRIFGDRNRRGRIEYPEYKDTLYCKPRKKLFTKQEMKEITARWYRNLPEVKNRERMEKLRQQNQINRLKAMVFNRKVQNFVLRKAGVIV